MIGILNAWEINTHRAIDKKALNLLKGENSNLNSFVENTNITNKEYRDEQFQNYKKSYFGYILKSEDGVSDWNQTFSENYNYQDILEAGSILEDSVYSNSWFSGDGRFNNHFYDPQQGGKGLTIGYGRRVNALKWTKDGWRNIYSYNKAIEYYHRAFEESTPEERNKYQAKMLVSVGHILHMVNDMNVPAHTRDDSHPFHEPLEKYMRGGEKGKEDIGFYVRGDGIKDNLNVGAVNEIKKYDNFAKYMTTEATYTSTHFVSEDTSSSLLVAGDIHPNANDVTLSNTEDLGDGLFKYYYISNENGKKLGIHLKSYLHETLEPLVNTSELSATSTFDGDNSVLQENGEFLIRRAVANAKGFVEYFFRGQIEANITEDGVVVKNISNPNTVKDVNTVTFKKEYPQANSLPSIEGEIQIYWDDENGMRHALLDEPHKLSQDLVPNSDETINDLDEEQKEKLMNHHITVAYKGVIGKERSIAVDATVTKEKHTTATLAFYYVYNCAGEVAGLKFRVYTTTNGVSKLIHTEVFHGFYVEDREPDSSWVIKDTDIFKDPNLYGNLGNDQIGGWRGKVMFESDNIAYLEDLHYEYWAPEFYRFIRVNRGGGAGGVGSGGHVGIGWGGGDGCDLPVLTYKVQTSQMPGFNLEQSVVDQILAEFE